MGVAAPRAPFGGRGPGPPQKFGHRSKFVSQLLSRNQVSQKNQGEPPPPLNQRNRRSGTSELQKITKLSIIGHF